MTSWLKRAEDLFEVVDRRAKLVVSELSEEQPNLQPTAPNGQIPQSKKERSKEKAQKRASANEALKLRRDSLEGSSIQSRSSEPTLATSPHKDVETPIPVSSQTSSKQSDEDEIYALASTNTGGTPFDDMEKHNAEAAEVVAAIPRVKAATMSVNWVTNSDNDQSLHDVAASPPTVIGSELHLDDHLVEPSQNTGLKDAQDSSIPIIDEKQLSHADVTDQHLSSQNQMQVPSAKIPPNKVQEQLDEAQGLLKSTNSLGQSKEARLARVCAGLSSRLQEYKSENAQLEEILAAERELNKSCELHVKQLQKELSASKAEMTRVETSMAEAISAKNSEIEALVSSLDTLKKQAALSEGNLASLQANMETLTRSRELTETRMMQAMREELALAERRAEEERIAHNATKKASMEREVELEHRAIEASTALARVQRVADDRTAKAAELEQKVALFEVECTSLNQELQDLEARIRQGQKRSPEDANQLIQMQAWQEEVERARQGQREAEAKVSTLEAELQKVRVEMSAMKRDAEHYSRQEHMELEKRYRELTDLLYYKQTQLETMASEKAAAEFQFEKEIQRLQEAKKETEKGRVSRRTSSSWEEDADMKELEPLPMFQRHMVGASVQMRKAAKLLDSGAVRAMRFLWRYPRARVSLLFYLVFVHLFLMYLLHRLQEQDENFAAREVAQSMGLNRLDLP